MSTAKKMYGTNILSVYDNDGSKFIFASMEEALATNPPFVVEIVSTQGKIKKEFYPVECDIEIMSRERVDAYTKKGKDVINNRLIHDLKEESTWIRLLYGPNYRYYIPFSTVGGKINLRYYKGLKK